jgi:thiamine-phosphate pyrophosphorylase
MRIAVISPEGADPREVSAIGGMIEAGLERYHVRKPSWTEHELEAWLLGLPPSWRPSLILHQHRELVAELGLGGWHDRDRDGGGTPGALSRSCHDVASLRLHMPAYGQILFGPVFPSLTKPDYGPAADFPWAGLRALLTAKRAGPCRVLAVGGMTAERLGRCRELGFDGAAVLGAVWRCGDPVLAFMRVREAAQRLEASPHAA